MKKRTIFLLIMSFCMAAIFIQVYRLGGLFGSLHVSGVFNEEQREQFQSILEADPLVTAYASYGRIDGSLLQDEHERRHTEASTILVSGDYVPAYAIRLLSGRFLLPDECGKAVLCAEQASELFCTYDCVGRAVLVDGMSYEVVGVYEPLGLAASLSHLGSAECFLAVAASQDQWVITISAGKETQREFTLKEMLSRLAVHNVSLVPLFRSRSLIYFLICLQCTILLLLLLASLWRHWSSLLQQSHPRLQVRISLFLRLTMVLLLCFVLSRFPLNPSYLPTAFTWDAIGQKLRQLLILFNNRTTIITMESSYLCWISYEIHFLSTCFWLAFITYLRKRRDRDA